MTVLFIDESKSKQYVLAVTVVDDSDVPRLRKQLQKLVKSGQRSLHFSGEKDQRRRKILSEIENLGLKAKIIKSDLKYELSARGHCFEQVIDFAIEVKANRIVIERDDSLFKFDEKCLKDLLKKSELEHQIGFEHAYRHEDQLLWVSDAIAWCHNRGGDWAKASAGLVYRT